MRSPNSVSTSGPHSRSAYAARCGSGTASAHSSQPSCEPAPCTRRSPSLIAIVSGVNASRDQLDGAVCERIPARLARQPRGGAQRGDRGRLRVGVCERRLGHRAVGVEDAAAVRRERVGGVAPALLDEAAGGPARPVPDQPSAALERTLEPLRSSAPRRRQLLGQRIVAERVEHHQEPRGAVGGAVIAQLAVSNRPAHVLEALLGLRAGTRARSCRAPRRCRGRRRCPAARPAPAASPGRRRAAREAPEAR